MKCFECDAGTVERRTIHVSKELRGVTLNFPAMVDVCDGCGAWEIPIEEADSFGSALDRAYRGKLGLLSQAEIRAARERLGMSQREFARYIGVGEASVKRWELGALQDKSSDEAIRLKTDPEYARRNLEQLCERLNIQSPPAGQTVFVKGPASFNRPIAAWISVEISQRSPSSN